MELRNITEANCGQVNPLAQLANALQDRSLRDDVGLPSTVDNMMAPQTFRMDQLMRETQEIESQIALVPLVPSSAPEKDHLWAAEYHNEIVQNNIQEPAQEEAQEFVMTKDILDELDVEIEKERLEEETRKQEAQKNVPDEETRPNEQTTDGLDSLSEDVSYDHKYVESKNMTEITNHLEKGKKLLAEGDMTGANVCFYAALDLEITCLEAWKYIRIIRHDEYYNYVHKDTKSQIPGFLQEGKELLSKGDVHGAVGCFHSVLTRDVTCVEAWKYLGTTSFPRAPGVKDYDYAENNPMLKTTDPLKKGKEFSAKGNIPGAILCFEAAVKQDDTCVEAWKLLGTTWAENVEGHKAIYALERGLRLEPHNSDIIMALAISYAEKQNFISTCLVLLAWLMGNPEYKDIVPENFSHPVLRHELKEMFIKAAQRRRRPVNHDYHVQYALGVLFYSGYEYDRAADCFRSALQVRPHDSRLWNLLGETLANDNRPEEAIDAYYRALNIDPRFVRARYNVGRICMNMKAYKDAIEHFLIALNQQGRERYDTSTIWSTLLRCISLMDRDDLTAALNDWGIEILTKSSL